MKEKINYYLIKVISVVVLLFSLSQVFLTIYLFGTTGMFKQLLYPAHSDIYNSLIFVTFIFVVDGIIGVFGSLGLFFFRKFGYYITLLAIVFYWLISLMQGGGPMMHWQVLAVATPILVYLLFQKRNIENFRSLNPSKGKKIIIISSVIFILAFLGSLVWMGVNLSSLQEQGKFPTVQNQTTTAGDKIEVTSSDIGQTVKAPLSVPATSVSNKASEIAGFHVYYPTFIPREFKMDATLIEITSSKTRVVCDLNDTNPTPTSPQIMILESSSTTAGENFIQKGADTLTSKQEVDINGDRGIAGTGTSSSGNLSKVIYITKDGTAVFMSTKDFDTDLLLKVARSMQ